MKPYDVEVRSIKNIDKAEKFIVKRGGKVTNKFHCDGAAIFMLRAFLTDELKAICETQSFIKCIDDVSHYKGQ